MSITVDVDVHEAGTVDHAPSLPKIKGDTGPARWRSANKSDDKLGN